MWSILKGDQLIINPEMRDQNFDFVKLFANVIWGNTQIFLPISLVMIGGWLIDRENTNDTMKNLLTVPVSYPKLLGGKLIVTIFLSILFGIYSVAITVLTGTLAGLDGFSADVLLRQGAQVVAAAFNTSLVCMPMILIFGQMRGAYLGGSLLTFFLYAGIQWRYAGSQRFVGSSRHSGGAGSDDGDFTAFPPQQKSRQ